MKERQNVIRTPVVVGRNKRLKKKMARSTKLIAGVAIILLVTAVASAAIMSFFAEQTTDFTVDNLFTWDGDPAENLIVSDDLGTVYGNTVETVDHILDYVGNDGVITVTFNWTGSNATDGVTPTVIINGSVVTEYAMSPGDNETVTLSYAFDPYITSGQYACILTIGFKT